LSTRRNADESNYSIWEFTLVVSGIAAGYRENLYIGIVLIAIALIVAASLKTANVWEKFVILRIGNFKA
jgi:hypothetical protein